MVGFGDSYSPKEPDLDRKAGPCLASDLSCHNRFTVCDGCMHSVEGPSLYLDSILAKVFIYDGMGYT